MECPNCGSWRMVLKDTELLDEYYLEEFVCYECKEVFCKIYEIVYKETLSEKMDNIVENLEK